MQNIEVKSEHVRNPFLHEIMNYRILPETKTLLGDRYPSINHLTRLYKNIFLPFVKNLQLYANLLIAKLVGDN